MHKEHQARLSQFARNRQPALRPPLDRKCILQIDLTATAGKAGNPLCSNFCEDSIAVPTSTKSFRPHESIILIVGVTDMFRRRGHTQSRQFRNARTQHCRMLPAGLYPKRKFSQLQASNGRWNLRQSPICSERFMQPAKPCLMSAAIHGVVTLSVILVRPGLFVHFVGIQRDHAAFAGGCNDLVLAKRKRADISRLIRRAGLCR